LGRIGSKSPLLIHEELADGDPLRLTAQNHQRRFNLFITRGIDHHMKAE
jgi:hypothetical protein